MVRSPDSRPTDGDLRRHRNREYRKVPAVERFWSKIERTPTGCWEWRAGRLPDVGHPPSSTGYGRFWTGDRFMLAHRWAYELLVGPIPAGLTLDHLCRNPPCVNPSHLEPVTQAENIRRGMPYRTSKPQRTRCKFGHEFIEGSYTVRPDGVFRCTRCVRDRADRRSEQRRLARIERFGYDPGPRSRAHLADYR